MKDLAGKLRMMKITNADLLLVTDPVLAEQVARTPMPWLKKKIPIVVTKDLDAIRAMSESQMNALGWFRKREANHAHL